MKLNQRQIDEALKDAAEALYQNPNKNVALVYPDGFVPNSYKYPAPAERLRVTRDGHRVETYDRKRSHARGSYITLWK